MKLTDRRLYQARNLEDFAFRYWVRDEDNRRRRNATREAALLAGDGFIAPDTNKIWGVDISHWDGNVNLSVTKDFGGDFVIIKAMDGTIPTRYWKENTARAIAAGLPNSSYAWLYPDNRINCTLQAQAYYNLIKDTPHSFPPVIDLEWTRYAGVQANPNYEDLRKWTAAFTRLSGVKPILYSAAGYMDMFGRMPDDLRAMFAGFHFASYGGLTLPTGFSSWDIHQFTASGDALALCPGDTNKKELDLNYMTESFFDRYVRVIPPVTEPGEIIMARYEATALGDNTRLRSTHDTTFAYIGNYPRGTKFHGDEVWTATATTSTSTGTVINQQGDKWLKVTDVSGAMASGWVAIRHKGLDICDLVDSAPATEPPAEPDEYVADFDVTLTAPDGKRYAGTVQGLTLREVE
jgi:GH25 family lysozyme M1 (1,4-beta-N-acetylmuramidase)